MQFQLVIFTDDNREFVETFSTASNKQAEIIAPCYLYYLNHNFKSASLVNVTHCEEIKQYSSSCQ